MRAARVGFLQCSLPDPETTRPLDFIPACATCYSRSVASAGAAAISRQPVATKLIARTQAKVAMISLGWPKRPATTSAIGSPASSRIASRKSVAAEKANQLRSGGWQRLAAKATAPSRL